jgi:serine/threonine-protein kinase RsbW
MRGIVEVRLPASPAMIPTVRTVASDLAARVGFDLDASSDLRMAVDEASVALVSRMSVDQELRCVFVLGPDRIEATVSALLQDPATAVLDTAGFSWGILRSLVDEVHTHIDTYPGDDSGTELISIRLVKEGPGT